MVGFVPTIHVFLWVVFKAWMLATRASMTDRPAPPLIRPFGPPSPAREKEEA